ncbi:MAG TPA: RodZ domain-containing protein [Nitrospirota bacterium]
MSTLGQYLRSAREARGIDLRDAAQQTRISIHYLDALETENFAKLPGEVFVKGFLKSYAKFLRLDESEVMIKYGELRGWQSQPVPAAPVEREPTAPVREPKAAPKTPLEPFVWGMALAIALVVFLFTALPGRRGGRDSHRAVAPSSEGRLESASTGTKPDKLYLEVLALDNTWVLVRTDDSPQKKAVLKKGESLIWSADERFEISYGDAGALKLQLNGQELTVDQPKNAVVRDLTITASGVLNRNIQPEAVKKTKLPRQPLAQPKTQPSGTVQKTANIQGRPRSPQPVREAPVSAPQTSLPWLMQ